MAEIPIQRKEGRNIWPMILGLVALAAVLWFLFGRNRNADTTAARTDSTAAMAGGVTTDSAAGTAANSMAGGAAGASGMAAGAAGTAGNTGGALADADIANVLHEVNAGEIATGEIARTKATNADVKAFARDMVVSHRAMDNKGAQLAVSKESASNVAIRDSITNANKTIGTQLQGLSGAAFDKAYIDGQVMAHQNTISFLQRAQNSAQNADLKQMITNAIPDVQKHLERAQSLQSRVGQ